mmetsp:Transcript_4433/g.14293  ORF Transcript_4433/g.14293 Transcript_4433/m.14293 type:complete len:310 (-) Transcript_4433:870-1799(-)
MAAKSCDSRPTTCVLLDPSPWQTSSNSNSEGLSMGKWQMCPNCGFRLAANSRAAERALRHQSPIQVASLLPESCGRPGLFSLSSSSRACSGETSRASASPSADTCGASLLASVTKASSPMTLTDVSGALPMSVSELRPPAEARTENLSRCLPRSGRPATPSTRTETSVSGSWAGAGVACTGMSEAKTGSVLKTSCARAALRSASPWCEWPAPAPLSKRSLPGSGAAPPSTTDNQLACKARAASVGLPSGPWRATSTCSPRTLRTGSRARHSKLSALKVPWLKMRSSMDWFSVKTRKSCMFPVSQSKTTP